MSNTAMAAFWLLLLTLGGLRLVLGASLLGWPTCQLQANTLVTRKCSLPAVVDGDISILGSYTSSTGLVDELTPSVESPQGLKLAPGAHLRMQNLVIVQQGSVLPLAFPLQGSNSTLNLTSVQVIASRAAFADYNASYWAALSVAPANATVYTDNATFLHVNYGGYPGYQQLVVKGLGLLANDDISNEERLAISLINSNDSSGQLNYVISATQNTLVPALRQLASIVTPVPLMVYVTANITLSKEIAGPGGIPINRPVILSGRVARKTSIDFRMEVNQFNLTASPYSNLTLDNLVLENLAYGDAVSASYSRASSLSITDALWPVLYNRTQVCLTVRNCTFVLASQTELDYITYWSTVYNSQLPYFQNQALYGSLRASIGAWDVASTGRSNSLILVKVLSRSLHVYDTLTTTVPQVAPALSLPPNDAINSPLTANQQPPVVLSVQSLQQLVGILGAPAPQLAAGERQVLRTILLLTQNMSWAPGAIDNWPRPGGLSINQPQKITGAPPEDRRRWAGALEVDLGYGQDLLSIPETLLQVGVMDFTLMQLKGLSQGPNAATATTLTEDAFTILLWSINRPRGIPGAIILRNATLRLPRQELDYIKDQASRASVFGIQPEGENATTIAFINVTIVDNNQLWVGSMEGYGITASRIRLLVADDADLDVAEANGYRWPPSASAPAGRSNYSYGTPGWLVAVAVIVSLLGAVALAMLGLVMMKRRRTSAAREREDEELGADMSDIKPIVSRVQGPCTPALSRTQLVKPSDAIMRLLGGRSNSSHPGTLGTGTTSMQSAAETFSSETVKPRACTSSGRTIIATNVSTNNRAGANPADAECMHHQNTGSNMTSIQYDSASLPYSYSNADSLPNMLPNCQARDRGRAGPNQREAHCLSVFVQVLPVKPQMDEFIRLWLVPVVDELLEDDAEGWQYAQPNALSRGVSVILPSDPVNIDVNLNMSYERDLVFPLYSYIGAGAFGQVHRAILKGRLPVAVKLMTGDARPQVSNSLIQEMQIMSRINHQNVVKCYGGCQTPPTVFIVEELMECSLADVLHPPHARGPVLLPLKRVLEIAADVANALWQLHPSIVHRDLKPGNVLLGPSGIAKVADFGLSRIKVTSYLATQNLEAGTTSYMAPECFIEELGVGEKSDIFSLGMMMFEMVTGMRPWAKIRNTWAIIHQVVSCDARPEFPESCDCPEALRRLIQACWRRSPRERPSAGDVLQRLSMLLKQLEQQDHSGL